MMNEQDIVGRLEQLGYKNADIRMALRDVGQIIVGKTAGAYLSKFPEQEQEHIHSFSEEALQEYLASHQGSLPTISQQDFEHIHDETWEDYFRSVT